MSCIKMCRDLSEWIRGQIIALSNEGMSQHKSTDKVSQKVTCSEPLQRFKETGSFSTKRRSGRPRITTQ